MNIVKLIFPITYFVLCNHRFIQLYSKYYKISKKFFLKRQLQEKKENVLGFIF